jgi:hypothetical protein
MRYEWLTAIFFGIAAGAGCVAEDSSDIVSDTPLAAPLAASDIEPGDSLVGECSSDADCELTPVYCESCRCAALTEGEELPACDGPEVQCFVNPCVNKKAVCLRGSCVVE